MKGVLVTSSQTFSWDFGRTENKELFSLFATNIFKFPPATLGTKWALNVISSTMHGVWLPDKAVIVESVVPHCL